MKNIVEIGEIAHFEQFHLFPQCFPKAPFLQCVTTNKYGEKDQCKVILQLLELSFCTEDDHSN